MFCCIHYALFLSIHKCISLRCSCFQWSAAVLFFLFLYLSFMKRRLTWAGYGAVGLWSRCCVWTLPPIDEHESLSPSPLTKRECKPHLWDHTGVPLVCTENKKKKKSSSELSMQTLFQVLSWNIHYWVRSEYYIIFENVQEALPYFI